MYIPWAACSMAGCSLSVEGNTTRIQWLKKSKSPIYYFALWHLARGKITLRDLTMFECLRILGYFKIGQSGDTLPKPAFDRISLGNLFEGHNGYLHHPLSSLLCYYRLLFLLPRCST